MIRKIVLSFIVFSMLVIVGCAPASKSFSGTGIRIELNRGFVEKEVIQAPLYLESQNHIFTGLRESKFELTNYGINSLEQYIHGVLNAHNKTATVEKFEADEVVYYYAYYTATLDREYGYMLFVMEGSKHFYTMNFGCLESKLEKNKDQFHKWAQSVIVD